MKRRHFLTCAAASCAGLVLAVPAAFASASKWYTGYVAGTGAGGYDVVAYFTEKKPVKGDAAITVAHDGAMWRFASAANRDLFVADPAKYLPQYGGYCAYAVAKGSTAKGDPEAWTVRDGKLYLNYSDEVRGVWSQDIPGNISRANANWPRVIE